MNFVLSCVLVILCYSQLITVTHAAAPIIGRAGSNCKNCLSSVNEDSFLSITVHESTARVFQSASQQTITLSGSGFAPDLSLVLDPPLQIGTDYTINVLSSTAAVLSLLPGKKWRDKPGCLLACGKGEAQATGYVWTEDTVCIATIAADPAPEVQAGSREATGGGLRRVGVHSSIARSTEDVFGMHVNELLGITLFCVAALSVVLRYRKKHFAQHDLPNIKVWCGVV